jgi:lipoprotein signal peptidase
MARSGTLLVLAAAGVAVADLVHKALVLSSGSSTAAHPRSALYVIGIALAATLWAGAIVLTRSTSIALAGGILAGGAAGNLVSLALWPSVDGVPNPLLAGDVAFNFADLAVAVGMVLLPAAVVVFALRNRERLNDSVRLRSY